MILITNEEAREVLQDVIDIYEIEDMYPLLKDRQISALKIAVEVLGSLDHIEAEKGRIESFKEE